MSMIDAVRLARQTDNCGFQVRSGRRLSMLSSDIDNCARVRETVPLLTQRNASWHGPASHSIARADGEIRCNHRAGQQ